MDYDGLYDHKNAHQRSGAFGPQYSPQSGYSNSDLSPKLRKQWFQKNDLDYYNNNCNTSLSKPDSFDSNYSTQEHTNFAKSNMNYDFTNYQRENNVKSNVVDERVEDNSNVMQTDNEKPYWLRDDVPVQSEPHIANDFGDAPNIKSRQNPDWLGDQTQQKPPAHTSFYQPMRNEGNRKDSEQPTNQTNSIMHKRFKSNPGLNIKSPFANDYKHDGMVVSENASAYGLIGSNSTQNVTNVYTKNNRLRTFRHQPSEMSKLLSFGYSKVPDGSGDAGGLGSSQQQHQIMKPDGLQKSEMMQLSKQSPYKPTCIERAEIGLSIQNQVDQQEVPHPSNLRDRSSSYGKKKLSFDEGRPEFFNISSRNEESEVGGPSPPNEGIFHMMGRDMRTNFRRRKMDINAPTLPGPLGSQMRR